MKEGGFMEKYNDLSLTSENREKPRAYYIPHTTRESAVTGEKYNSAVYGDLNGDWQFAYFETPQDLPDDLGEICFENRQTANRRSGHRKQQNCTFLP